MSADERVEVVNPRLEALIARAEGLARENRRYRALVGLAIVLAAASLAMGQASPAAEEVRARRFVLVDETGQTRGALTAAPGGPTLLVLADERHRVRLSASVAANGSPELALYGDGAQRRLIAGVDAANAPFLSLRNREDASATASLSLTAAGAPLLMLADATGKPRLVAAVSDDEVSLTLKAADNGTAALLAARGDTSRLALADSTGTDRLWAAIRRESPVLQFFDRNRVARSGLATINDEAGLALMSEATGASFPGVVLYGKDRKVLWSAPN